MDIAVRRSLDKHGISTHFRAFAETEPQCLKVLEHHYPGVENVGDITKVDDWTPYSADIITAGFPCQPFSVAGKRLGVSDERYIWPSIEQAIRDIRPGYVFLENVKGFRSSGFEAVATSLATHGYDIRWHSNRAADIGAPHRRERVFIIARPVPDSDSLGRERGEGA
ncbi:DNA methyltransferase [Gordonia phage Camerico]|nr:DNA methyltransferase [Gordonia phage Camerico]